MRALLLLACLACTRAPLSAPQPESVIPESIELGVEVAVTIRGQGFRPDVHVDFATGEVTFDSTFSAALGETALEQVVYIAADQLEAVVPATLDAGTYDLTVRDPSGRTGAATAAFTVLSDLACHPTCTACAAGGCCTELCAADCEIACPADCSCDVTCDGGDCGLTCGAGSACALDCTGSSACFLDCSAADDCSAAIHGNATLSASCTDASCHFGCGGANSCEIGCHGDATCDIGCRGANSCDKTICASGAACLIDCRGSDHCGFFRCDGVETSCDDQVLVCNRECP